MCLIAGRARRHCACESAARPASAAALRAVACRGRLQCGAVSPHWHMRFEARVGALLNACPEDMQVLLLPASLHPAVRQICERGCPDRCQKPSAATGVDVPCSQLTSCATTCTAATAEKRPSAALRANLGSRDLPCVNTQSPSLQGRTRLCRRPPRTPCRWLARVRTARASIA